MTDPMTAPAQDPSHVEWLRNYASPPTDDHEERLLAIADELERNEGKNDYYERQHYPRECPACNGLVTKATGYQCVDCDRWYHRECLRKHCAGELEQVAAQLSETRAERDAREAQWQALLKDLHLEIRTVRDERDAAVALVAKLEAVVRDGIEHVESDAGAWGGWLVRAQMALRAIKKQGS